MTIRHVPGTYADAATALAASAAGDTILMALSGSPYSGANNKNLEPAIPITIQLEAGVVIDLDHSGRFVDAKAGCTDLVVECANGEATIQNGIEGAANGGAILYNNAELYVGNIHFVSNQAVNGGALAGTAEVVVWHSTFASCQAGNNGGAVYCSGATVKFFNNLFSTCAALNGGGIYSIDCDVTIANVTFASCGAGANGGGIAIADTVAHTQTMLDSILWGNTAVGDGDQIYIADDTKSVVSLDYCTCPTAAGNIFGTLAANTHALTSDPKFVNDYYLKQVHAGDTLTSPAFGSGSRMAVGSIVEGRTTRKDLYNDEGTIDRGYHYVGNGLNLDIFIECLPGNSISSGQAAIEKATVVKGTGRSVSSGRGAMTEADILVCDPGNSLSSAEPLELVVIPAPIIDFECLPGNSTSSSRGAITEADILVCGPGNSLSSAEPLDLLVEPTEFIECLPGNSTTSGECTIFVRPTLAVFEVEITSEFLFGEVEIV